MTTPIQRRRARPNAHSQRGLSLVTTLLFTVAALVLGVSVLGVNVMQERIIGNTRDRSLALQAAEAALRDAEIDIQLTVTPATAFSDACLAGLCTAPTLRSPISPLPVDKQIGFDWATTAKVRTYGQYSAAPALPDILAPVYVIEYIGDLGTPIGGSISKGFKSSAPGPAYRITARATGARPETVVILQSIFALRN